MTVAPVRTILHVDMDAFFAAVEVLDNPGFRGRPVIVGAPAGERGVVSASSYEARKFGIHSAMPMAKAVRLCPDGVFVRPRHRRYSEVSEGVMAIMGSFTPLMEQVSVDEAYLDVSGCEKLFGDGPAIARRIKQRVLMEIGLTCSVGVAPNKFLSKVASDLEKPDGLTIVPPGREADFLARLPIEKIHGVGPATASLMYGAGIRTIGELALYPPARLAGVFGDSSVYLQALARGEDDSPVETGREAKSISREETFAVFLHDSADVERKIQELSDEVASELRSGKLKARTVHLKVRNDRFQTLTRSITLAESTDVGDVVYTAAWRLYREKVDLDGRAVRLLGVGTSNFLPMVEAQMSLFGDQDGGKRGKIARIIDAIKGKHGQESVVRGSLINIKKTGKENDAG